MNLAHAPRPFGLITGPNGGQAAYGCRLGADTAQWVPQPSFNIPNPSDRKVGAKGMTC